MTASMKPGGMLLGLLGNVAFGWGLYKLMGIGSCGGDYAPCPSEATPYFLAIPAGIIASVVATFIGGGVFAFTGIFATVGIASILRGFNGGVDGDTTFPFVFGGCFAASALLPAFLLIFARGKAKNAMQLVATGKRGVATVVSVHDTGMTINDNPRVELTVTIAPEDGSPSFEGKKAMTVSRVAIPRAGDRYPVWYDAEDPSKFGLGTEVDATASAEIRALFAKAGRLPGVSIPATATAEVVPERLPDPTPSAPAPGMAQDWVEQLGKLNELRMAGALTDEQFEQAKLKLLSPAS
jgi:hypothetical protein